MVQLFGYDLDFYTDPRRGDTFRLVVEKKKYEHGETAGYGRILAAEYVNGSRNFKHCCFTIRWAPGVLHRRWESRCKRRFYAHR